METMVRITDELLAREGNPQEGRGDTVAVRDLEHRIKSRRATVGVVGQGYVGFPLAQRIAQSGMHVYGYDVSDAVVAQCNDHNRFRRYEAISSAALLGRCDVVVIAVPTPTRDDDTGRSPDLSLVVAATRNALAHLPDDGRARLLILESTYAPGTTRNVVAPLVNVWHGLGINVFLGYSPERIDPGNPRFEVANTPKVTGGYDDTSARLTRLFYSRFIQSVVPASSLEAAEATKILENTFRLVNIAFAQEFDEYCERVGISSEEVTALAATKPFGFMPFYAGAGVGGHCIAEDPYFLLESALEAGAQPEILQAALRNHEARAAVIVRRIAAQLPMGVLRGARILILGVTYKPDVADPRRSPALAIMQLLEQGGATVDYHDPLIPFLDGKRSLDPATTDPEQYDLAVIITRHSSLKPEALARAGWPLYDVRRQLRTQGRGEVVPEFLRAAGAPASAS